MIIKNTTTNNAWVLPEKFQLPKGRYVDMKFVETLPKEWQEAIKADIESNDAKPHMNEALGMRHTFIVEKQSVYTKHARTLVSRYKYAKKGRKGE